MCIAILNTPKQILSKQTLKNCWDNNYDGAGMLYIKDGSLTTFKELDSFKKFFNHYKEAKKANKKSWFVLHFRISTHGKVNETNCHPFMVNPNLGFVHNGIISGVGSSESFSDTYLFNQTILKGLPEGFEHNEATKVLLDSFIDSSKLIFLNSRNEWSIINEEAGHWADGNWFSNNSYKCVSRYLDYGGTKVLRGDYRMDDDFKWKSIKSSNKSCTWCMNPQASYVSSEQSYLCKECVEHFVVPPKINRDIKDRVLDFDLFGDPNCSVYVEVSNRDGVLIAYAYSTGEEVISITAQDDPEIFSATDEQIKSKLEGYLWYDNKDAEINPEY